MYSYFDSNGPRTIPHRREVERLAAEHGVLTALVADANVCLDLAAFGRTTLQPDNEERVEFFIAEIAASGVDVVPGFGLAELSLDRATWQLDSIRLESIQKNITRAIDSAPERAPPRGENINADDRPVDAHLFDPLTPLLKLYYASLLRVALVSADGVGRASAVNNFKTLLEWLAGSLNCVPALVVQAAAAIFGGDSLARKLIGVGKTSPTLDDVWSGAWDLFYIHQLYYGAMREIDGVPHYFIFVTRDRACFSVFSRSRLKGLIRLDEDRNPLLIGVDTDYPHYADDQATLARLFKEIMAPRIQKLVAGERMTMEHLDDMIIALEREWHGRNPKGAT